MTVQTSDILNYNNKIYYLIDVDKRAVLINTKDYSNDGEAYIMSTACWRGYQVELSVKDDSLHIIKYNGKKINEILPFTGTIIAVRENNGYFNTDFLSAIFEFNEVLELAFDSGKLTKVNDLSRAIKQYNENTSSPNNNDGYEFFTSNCLGTYGGNTYKWRSNESDKDDETDW